MTQQLLFWTIDLLLPAALLAVGMFWRGAVPRCPSDHRGYRTPRSMQSSRAWRYAQRCFAELCVRSGGALALLVTADRGINLITRLMPAARLSHLNAVAALVLALSIVPLVELSLARRTDLVQSQSTHCEGCAGC